MQVMKSINIGGKLLEVRKPLVMGILNVTPDSFYAGSRVGAGDLAARGRRMLADGASILDLGGCSTRPGSAEATEEEELQRLLPALEELRQALPDAVISVDTFRASVARRCVAAGADIINDVSGGRDPEMFGTVAELGVPYVLTHSRGDSSSMQSMTDYAEVVAEVLEDLAFKTDRLHQTGVCDVVIDPGFGFAKTPDQCYRLLASLEAFGAIGCPILAGLSRKSMIWKELRITPDKALNGTTALNMAALINGADILRVHDVREAAETVGLYEAYRRNIPQRNTITTTDRNTDTTHIQTI